jgi:protoporphyrin/coproporphyrin ferrochelatase
VSLDGRGPAREVEEDAHAARIHERGLSSSVAAAKAGVLLAQLGTPASPSTRDVRRYLREFLSDPLVIDLPAPARWLLVNGVIAPFRAPRSAHAYRAIWRPEGSPLRIHTDALGDGLRAALGSGFAVEVGMRYGEPALEGALDRLTAAGAQRIVVAALYPQHAESSRGTALAAVQRWAASGPPAPELVILPPFFAEPGFAGAVAAAAQPLLAELRPEHVLMSYHGLPESHVLRADPTRERCLARPNCCALPGATDTCYRAQCFATTRAVAERLGLPLERVSTSFQSRLGRARWIGPSTDATLVSLAGRGVRRLLVLCPSFVADCLETLEEIGIRARERWLSELRGEAFAVAPCPNASAPFVEFVAAQVRAACASG